MAEANGFIVAAYVVAWVGILGYAFYLHGASRRARVEYEEASRDSGGGHRE